MKNTHKHEQQQHMHEHTHTQRHREKATWALTHSFQSGSLEQTARHCRELELKTQAEKKKKGNDCLWCWWTTQHWSQLSPLLGLYLGLSQHRLLLLLVTEHNCEKYVEQLIWETIGWFILGDCWCIFIVTRSWQTFLFYFSFIWIFFNKYFFYFTYFKNT